MEFNSREDVGVYSDFLRYSVGFNPRTTKRLLNSLQLLTILDRKRNDLNRSASISGTSDAERSRHASKVLFGVLCMMECYEPIYDYLAENALSSDRILELRNGLLSGEGFAELRRKLETANIETVNSNDVDTQVAVASMLRSAVAFIERFVDCLQMDADDNLSSIEVKQLQEVLSTSALVSTGHQLQEFDSRNFALNLRGDLNEEFRNFVEAKKPKYGKFRMDKGTVYLDLPFSCGWLLMGRDESTFYFDIRSYKDDQTTKDNLIGLGESFCAELSWGEGEYYDMEHENVYRFFEQSTSTEDSEELYREELFTRLTTLTKPLNKLYALCRSSVGA